MLDFLNATILRTKQLLLIHTNKHPIYTTLSSTAACGCKRPCKQEYYKIRIVEEKTNGNAINVGTKLHNEAMETLKEKYEYDIPKLLADFGGNLGLFLGLSLLSTIQLGQVVMQKIKSLKKVTKSTLGIKIEEKIGKTKESYKLPEDDKSLFRRFVNTIAYMALIAISSYILFERVKYYLTVPTRYVIEVQKNETMYLPKFLACGETGRLTSYKKRITKNDNKNPCDIHFLDVLDTVKSLDKLWKLFSLHWHNILAEQATKGVSLNDNFHRNKTLIHSGTCYEFDIIPFTYAGAGSAIVLVFQDMFDTTCNDGLWQFYVRPHGKQLYSILQSRHDVLNSVFGLMNIRISELQRLNTDNRPCMMPADVELCKDSCYESVMNSSIQCRLPFMEFYHYPLCNSSKSAKKTYNIYLKTALEIDKKCPNCFTSCHQHLYTPELITVQETAIKYDVHVLGVGPISNLIEIVKEELIYNLVALFCDIGNIFGLTLGLSVLTLFAYIKSLIDFVSHKVLSTCKK